MTDLFVIQKCSLCKEFETPQEWKDENIEAWKEGSEGPRLNDEEKKKAISIILEAFNNIYTEKELELSKDGHLGVSYKICPICVKRTGY